MRGLKIAAWGLGLVATLLTLLHLQILGSISLRFSALVVVFFFILIGMILIAGGFLQEVMEQSLLLGFD